MDSSQLSSAQWFNNLDQMQQQLAELSFELLEREKKLDSKLFDYSFILFPISKAYEGYLKTFLFQLGLISEQVYMGRKFRIGRALNPDMNERFRDQWWLYDDLSNRCSEEMARKIWDAWIACRNHIFHYFPAEKNQFSIQEIENRMNLLIEVFESMYQCQIHGKMEHAKT
jgi:hypothetical protein